VSVAGKKVIVYGMPLKTVIEKLDKVVGSVRTVVRHGSMIVTAKDLVAAVADG